MKNGKLKAVVVGLGFGGAFVPIWRDHPDVGEVGVCELDPKLCARVAAEYGISLIYPSLDEVLADETVDAVHLVTAIPDHAEQTVRVLDAGKHCACTVPMATTMEGIQAIRGAVERSGKKYMMMETTLYTYQYLYVKRLLESGELGRVQFLRGSHYQDMENWPSYWAGLPPFWYGTHAIAPLVGLSGSRITAVSCLGSGTMRPELTRQYGNPFPIETAHFRFENGLAAEATRSLFETARTYQEGLFVYGSKKSFEWGFADGDKPYVTSLLPADEAAGRPRGLPRRWKSSRTCRTTSLPFPSLSGATPSAATTIPPIRSSALKRGRAAVITAPTPTWFMSLSAALSRTALPPWIGPSRPTSPPRAFSPISRPFSAAAGSPSPAEPPRSSSQKGLPQQEKSDRIHTRSHPTQKDKNDKKPACKGAIPASF